MNINELILTGRYRITGGPLPIGERERGEPRHEDVALHVGRDVSTGATYLIKRWHESGDLITKALWHAELRTLYRLSGTRGAAQTLVRLHDASAEETGYYMVLKSECESETGESIAATDSVARVLAEDQLRWLAKRELVWEGLKGIAEGLERLHRNQVLHRHIVSENVFFDRSTGPTSFRLGGFEWSVRLVDTGMPTAQHHDWSTPPEFSKDEFGAGYTHATDWYAFGMLAARLLLPDPGLDAMETAERHATVCERFARNHQFRVREAGLIRRLLEADPNDRLRDSEQIIPWILAILQELRTSNRSAKLHLVYNPWPTRSTNDPSFSEEASRRLEGSESEEPKDPQKLREEIERDLESASIIRDGRHYAIQGSRLRLKIVPFEDKRSGKRNWDRAFARVSDRIERSTHPIYLPRGSIQVVPLQHRNESRLPPTLSWENFFPPTPIGLPTPLHVLQDFLRCTNHLELLMRTREIIPFAVIELVNTGKVQLTLKQEDVTNAPNAFSGVSLGKLFETELAKPGRIRQDTGTAFLFRPGEDARQDPRQQRHRQWRVISANSSENTVVLESLQETDMGMFTEGDRGQIRSANLGGTFTLILRRHGAIDRLRDHGYLLQALQDPLSVRLDTGQSINFTSDAEELSTNKQRVLQNIVRTRPIYAVQGPPGTGKTRLVTALVWQILHDDPAAQILLAAPEHGAVDVLLSRTEPDKLRPGELDAREERLSAPLAVRLYSRDDQRPRSSQSKPHSAKRAVRALLENSNALLGTLNSRTPLQEKWLASINQALAKDDVGEHSRDFENLTRLARLGANLTYTTTSSGDLEELAKGVQTFDWCIIEEAGKSHGHDLALPMQTAYRWVLIGDHRQLRPFRYEEYERVLRDPDELLTALQELATDQSQHLARLRDDEWLLRFTRELSKNPDRIKAAFEPYLSGFFSHVWSAGGAAQPQHGGAENGREMATTLKDQRRMHPTLGDLVAELFYNDTWADPPVIGSDPRRRFTFEYPDGHSQRTTHRCIVPPGIEGKQLVWLNVPWLTQDRRVRSAEISTAEAAALISFLHDFSRNNLSSSPPSEFAILSPYKKQVQLLNRIKPLLQLPDGVTWKNPDRVAWTGDEFQGNEADIIALSLVRNQSNLACNQLTDSSPLGFLLDPERPNVLLSRAKALLIIVGSWEFIQNAALAVSVTWNTRGHWRALARRMEQLRTDGNLLFVDARDQSPALLRQIEAAAADAQLEEA